MGSQLQRYEKKHIHKTVDALLIWINTERGVTPTRLSF